VQATFAGSQTGIPAQMHPKIFDPSFNTKGDRGTGLGLWSQSSLPRGMGVRSACAAGLKHQSPGLLCGDSADVQYCFEIIAKSVYSSLLSHEAWDG
jgi:hypothetical protein